MVLPAPGAVVLVQITSKPYGDARAIQLEDGSLGEGSLRITSYARPGRLFTGNRELIAGRVGRLKPEAFRKLVDSLIALLQAGI